MNESKKIIEFVNLGFVKVSEEEAGGPITEQLLVDLGFEREDVSEEEAGGPPFYYFTYDFTDRGVFSLISNASNEVEEDSWKVEVFEDSKINFNSKTLTKFMNVMKEVLNESNS
jgi:hypothetical protein